MALNYNDIVKIATAKATALFDAEYKKVSYALEANIIDCAKKGYFFTMVPVKTSQVEKILEALKANYPGFTLYINEKTERSEMSSITCSWSGKYS